MEFVPLAFKPRERLGMVGDKLCYSLPKPTPDGQTIMVLKPRELLHKLAQLIPPRDVTVTTITEFWRRIPP
jgi:hypothetical protein